MDGKTHPHYDQQTEEAILGHALVFQESAELLARNGHQDLFTTQVAQVTFLAIQKLVNGGYEVGVLPVSHACEDLQPGAVTPADLLALRDFAVSRNQVPQLLAKLQQKAALRRASAEVAEAHAMLMDPTVNLAKLSDRLIQAGRQIDVPVTEVSPSPDIDAFVGIADEPYDWVVPNLLERKDRLLLTGGEGQGKSTLLRKMAVTMAAGCHPFKHTIIQPQRVLIIDAENTERQMRRALGDMVGRVRSEGYKLDPDYLRVELRHDIDLKTPGDQRWLYERVQAAQPDVVVIGPLYKLGAVGNEEDPAKEVLRVLDNLRERWGVTLLMETHSPHSDGATSGRRPVRPYGASIWMRWPEFGYGLVADKENPDLYTWFIPWRGPRDVREWPMKLERGGKWMWRTAA